MITLNDGIDYLPETVAKHEISENNLVNGLVKDLLSSLHNSLNLESIQNETINIYPTGIVEVSNKKVSVRQLKFSCIHSIRDELKEILQHHKSVKTLKEGFLYSFNDLS